jgi:hypothetical protein
MTTTLIGRIIRLQMQRRSLKAGEGRAAYYDPAPILSVDAFSVTTEGVVVDGPDGMLLDVHHAQHPLSKNRALSNSVSIGFTSHYERMRDRFGAHITEGVAGENILVESERMFDLTDLNGGLVIEGDDGRRIPLESLSVAHPCTEFSRFALADRLAEPRAVAGALRFLDDGMRGFYAVVPSDEPLRVRVGDRICRAREWREGID